MSDSLNTSCNFLWLNEVDSTNTYAGNHFEEFPDATLIIAHSQSSGRGRKGRSWLSPPGTNLYASFLMKEWPYPASKASWIASLATLNLLRSLPGGLDFWLKWPNDIFCGNKKVAGILCETRVSKSLRAPVIIAGIGVNLNMEKSLLDDIGQPACSVFSETGEKISIEKFAIGLGKSLGMMYHSACYEGVHCLFTQWRTENRVIGREVLLLGDNVLSSSGRIEDIDCDGAILFTSDDGCRSRFLSGDVSIRI